MGLLPPNLVNLSLPVCSYIWDEHVKFLPRSLKCLFLGKSTLTEACLGDLPAGLKELSTCEQSAERKQQRPTEMTIKCCIQ